MSDNGAIEQQQTHEDVLRVDLVAAEEFGQMLNVDRRLHELVVAGPGGCRRGVHLRAVFFITALYNGINRKPDS